MNRTAGRRLSHFATVILLLLGSLFAFAGPERTTYQAKIIKPDGYPLEASSVNFKFTILDPAGICILYSETYSSVNMTSTGGLISFSLGSGVKTYPVSSPTFADVFSNITPTLSCEAGVPPTYTPNATDIRKIVMQFHDGGGWQTLPAMNINAVPYAMYAGNAEKLSGLAATDFVRVSIVPTCTASEAIRYNGTMFSCVAVDSGGQAVTSGSVITALGYTPADGASLTTITSNISNVSSTLFSVSSTVASLASSVAASFSAVTSSQWVTSASAIYYNSGYVGIGVSSPGSRLTVANITPDTPVINEGANSISLFGNGHAYFQGRDVTNGVEFIMGTSTASGEVFAGSMSSHDFTLRTGNNRRMTLTASGAVGIGTTTPVTKLDVSGGVRISMEAAACAVSFAGTLRYNSGLVEYCDGAAWSAFGVAGAGITLLNGSASGTQTFVTGISGTNFDITSSNGVHTFNIALAASSSVTAGLLSNADYVSFTNKLNATSAAVITAMGYTPANSATVSTLSSNLAAVSTSAAAANTNVAAVSSTVAALQTSVTSLTSTTAASFAAITSSQWVTSGSTINYSAGNVGIGTTNPTVGLEVSGRSKISTSLANVFTVTGKGTTYADATDGIAVFYSEVTTGAGGNIIKAGSAYAPNTFVVKDSGYVGIGTTSPGYKLDVNGTTNTVGLVTPWISGGGNGNGLYFGNAAGDATFYNSATANIQKIKLSPVVNDYVGVSSTVLLNSNGSSYLNGGNVGIGTTSPAQALHVNGNERVDGAIYGQATAGSGDVLFVGNDSKLRDIDLANTLGVYGQQDSTQGHLKLGSAGPVISGVSGNVGIGTSSPSSTAHVGGNLTVGAYGGNQDDNADYVIKSNGQLQIQANQSGSSNTSYVHLVLAAGISGSTNSAVVVQTIGAERMRIDATGNVGIGVMAPTAKLHLVSGTASTAPLKFTSGTLLSSPQSGTMEYDGANFYLTDSANTRRTIATGSSANTIDNASNINSTGNIVMTPNNGSNSVIVSSTVASTSSNTGALVVNGGLGVAGNINAGGSITTSANIQGVSVTATSGMISPYIAGSVNASGNLTLDSTTHATKGNILLAPNGGNVGIGTTTPDKQLTMHSTGTDNYIHLTSSLTGTTNLDGVMFGTGSSGDAAFYNRESTNMLFFTSNTERVRIDAAGNVGIGTTTPTAKLDVVGTLGLYGGTLNGDSLQRTVIYSDDVNHLLVESPTVSSTRLNTYFSNRGYGTGGSRMMINGDSGNVGIGTSAPTARLEARADSGSIFTAATSSTSVLNVVSNKDIFMNTDHFVVKGSGTGYVGVGTTTPGEKFDVFGNMRIGSTDSNYIAFRGTTSDGAGSYNHTYIGERFYAAGESSELLLFKGNDSDNTSGPDRIRLAGGNILFDTYATPDAPSGTFEAVATSPMISTKMIIKGNGNVGIGTSAPAVKTHIYNQVDGPFMGLAIDNRKIYGAGTGINETARMIFSLSEPSVPNVADRVMGYIEGGTEAETSSGNTFMAFGTRAGGPGAETEKMRINSLGYVGIGTTAPQGSLHIRSATSQTNGPGEGIFLGKSANTNNLDYQLQVTTAGGGTPHIDISRGTNTDYDGRIASYADGAISISTIAGGQLIVASGANVGINNLTPAYRLDVGGSALIRGGAAHSNVNPGYGGTFFSFDGPTNTAGIWSVNATTSQFAFYTKTDNTDAGTERLRIDSTGQVGIGTSSPSAKLNIGGLGAANATALRIDSQDTFYRDIFISEFNTTAYGGILRYNSGTDLLQLITVENGVEKYGLAVARATGNVGIGMNSAAAYPLDVSGSIRISGAAYRDDGVATWAVTSDARLKDVIAGYDRGLKEILDIDTVIFKYKKDNPRKLNSIKEFPGVVAQQVQKVIPEAVDVEKDGFLSLNTTPIIWAMLNAIKEVYHEVTGVQREIASLKEQNQAKEQEIKELKERLDRIEKSLQK